MIEDQRLKNDNMPSKSFSHSVLRMIVAKICQDVGWHTTHDSALNLLSDVLAHYIRQLSIVVVDYANHGGRSEPTIDDLYASFKHLDIDISQLQDFIVNVDPSPLPIQLPFYPIKKCKQDKAFDEPLSDSDVERPDYYEDWMPPLNPNKSISSIENGEEPSLPLNANGINDNETEKIKIEPKSELLEEKKDSIVDQELENAEKTSIEENNEKKNKLVFRFSLGKSLEEEATETEKMKQDDESNNQNETTSEVILRQLKSSSAFMKFTQSLLYKNPNSSELKSSLRVPDRQRLPNNHESRPNSPENESLNSNILNGSINSNDGFVKNPELEHEMINSGRGGSSKKATLKSKKKFQMNDSINYDDGDVPTPNIKVKEIGVKKERKSDTGDSNKKIKGAKKSIKPLNIKVTGFGLDDGTPSDLTETPTPKKRQYKKKNPDQRKSTNKAIKIMLSTENLDNIDETPRSPFSFLEKDRPTSPSKLKNNKKVLQQESLSKNEAAQMLVLMSESNDAGTSTVKFNDPIPNSELESMGENSNIEHGKGKQKMVKPTSASKRTKGTYTKKSAKSAELVESSGDSSSDDNVDSKPTILLSQEQEIKMKSIMEQTTVVPTVSGRKRNHSSSSVSSASSINSSISIKSAIKRSDTPVEPPVDKLKSKSNEPLSSINSDNVNLDSTTKHKKNKKHSKEKHKHHSEDGKPHKKHKKIKLDKESKQKSKEKGEKTNFKPKLNIKLGPNIKEEPGYDSLDNLQALEIPLFDPMITNENKDSGFPKHIDDKPIDMSSGSSAEKKMKIKSSKKKNPEPTFNELPVFIKDHQIKPKEGKTNKTSIINVSAGANLFEDAANFDKLTSKPLKQSKVKIGSTKEPELSIKKSESSKSLENVKPNKQKKEKMSGNSALSIVFKNTEEKVPKKDKVKPETQLKVKTIAPCPGKAQCTLFRETIEIEALNEEEKVWICPTCSKPDDGSPMIACDICEDWYHYICVGILSEPKEDEMWFCPKCPNNKQSKPLKQDVSNTSSSSTNKKRKDNNAFVNMKQKQKIDNSNSVTITPIGSSTMNIDSKNTNKFSGEPEISFIPIGLPGSSSQQQQSKQPGPSVTITPTSSATKPSGRPRGRPRKDSGQPNMTITPIGVGSFPPPPPPPPEQPPFMMNNYPESSSKTPFIYPQGIPPPAQPGQIPPYQAKRSIDICGHCRIDDENPGMVACDKCDQWFHLACMGLLVPPRPEVQWFCPKCRKKKSSSKKSSSTHNWPRDSMLSDQAVTSTSGSMSLTDAKFLALTGGLGPSSTSASRRSLQQLQQANVESSVGEEIDVGDSTQTQKPVPCSGCHQTSHEIDERWIACDFCDQWYHYICAGVSQTPPANDPWFCKKCIQKQRNIVSRFERKRS